VKSSRSDPGAWRWALARSDLPPRARLVGHTLALHMDSQGVTFVGVRVLADETNQAKKTIERCLEQLVEVGYLLEGSYERGRRRHRYATVPVGYPEEDSPNGSSGLPRGGHPREESGLLPGSKWATSGVEVGYPEEDRSPDLHRSPCRHQFGEIPQEGIRICTHCHVEEPLPEAITRVS